MEASVFVLSQNAGGEGYFVGILIEGKRLRQLFGVRPAGAKLFVCGEENMPFAQVLKRSRVVGQVALKLFLREVQNAPHAFPLLLLFPFFGRQLDVFYFDVISLCEGFYRFRKCNSFLFHQEVYRVSTFSTGETFTDIFRRRNVKGRLMIFVERAKPDIVNAFFTEGYKVANHI
jgi:hypothetical protein